MSASSAPQYGIALLQTLHALGSVETHLVLSDGARRTIQLEADLDPELVCRLADVVHHPNNLAASISSRSFLANYESITSGGLTCVVDRISRQGLVERVRDESEGRGQMAVLTDAGFKRLEHAWPTPWRASAST